MVCKAERRKNLQDNDRHTSYVMSFPTIYRSLITSSRVKTTNCIFFTTVFFTPPQSSPVQSSPAEHGTAVDHENIALCA
jgi:hypothetical protein